MPDMCVVFHYTRRTPLKGRYNIPQQGRDAVITSLWRRNDVATAFWRHNDIIIDPCARWVPTMCQCLYLISDYRSVSPMRSRYKNSNTNSYFGSTPWIQRKPRENAFGQLTMRGDTPWFLYVNHQYHGLWNLKSRRRKIFSRVMERCLTIDVRIRVPHNKETIGVCREDEHPRYWQVSGEVGWTWRSPRGFPATAICTRAYYHDLRNSPLHEISASWRECILLLCAVKHSVQWWRRCVVRHQSGADLGLSPKSFSCHIGNQGSTIHSKELYHRG